MPSLPTVTTGIATPAGAFRIVSERVQDETFITRLFGPGESQNSGSAGYILGTHDAYSEQELDATHASFNFEAFQIVQWVTRLALNS